ncbi:hypothetical protein Tco_0630393, partial [Tanacetum coccineum]
VRFEREHKPKQPGTFNKKDTRTGVPKAGVPCTMPSGIPRGSFASILKEGSPSLSNPDLQTPAIVLEDSCLKERDFSMSLMGLWVLIKLDSHDSFEKLRNHIGVGSWFSSIKPASNSFVSDERIVWVSLEGLPINVWTMNTFFKVAAKWGDLVVWEDSEENSLSCNHLYIMTKNNVIIHESFKLFSRVNSIGFALKNLMLGSLNCFLKAIFTLRMMIQRI